MDTSNRELNGKELKELQEVLSIAPMVFRLFLFLLLACFVGFVFFVLNSLSDALVEFTWWPFAALLCLIFVFIYSKKWTGGGDFRKQMAADFRNGVAEVVTLKPTVVLKFAEIEDEGVAFVIEDEDGCVFCSSGQELSRLQRKGFPRKEVTMIQTPLSKHVFELKTSGDKIDFWETQTNWLDTDLSKRYAGKVPFEKMKESIEQIKKLYDFKLKSRS